jgi:hypothetical protein
MSQKECPNKIKGGDKPAPQPTNGPYLQCLLTCYIIHFCLVEYNLRSSLGAIEIGPLWVEHVSYNKIQRICVSIVIGSISTKIKLKSNPTI